MSFPQLNAYIRDRIKQGADRDSIMKELLPFDWTAIDIDRALYELSTREGLKLPKASTPPPNIPTEESNQSTLVQTQVEQNVKSGTDDAGSSLNAPQIKAENQDTNKPETEIPNIQTKSDSDVAESPKTTESNENTPPNNVGKKRPVLLIAIALVFILFVGAGVFAYFAFFKAPNGKEALGLMIQSSKNINSAKFAISSKINAESLIPVAIGNSSLSYVTTGAFVFGNETSKTKALTNIKLSTAGGLINNEVTLSTISLDDEYYLKAENISGKIPFLSDSFFNVWLRLQDDDLFSVIDNAPAGLRLPTGTESNVSVMNSALDIINNLDSSSLISTNYIKSEEIAGVKTFVYSIKLSGEKINELLVGRLDKCTNDIFFGSICDSIKNQIKTLDIAKSVNGIDLFLYMGKKDHYPYRLVFVAKNIYLGEIGTVSIENQIDLRDHNKTFEIVAPTENIKSIDEILNESKNASIDLTIKSEFATIKSNAKIIFDTYGNYNRVCGANKAPISKDIQASLENIKSNNRDVVCAVPKTGNASSWAVFAQLSNSEYWCADSRGVTKSTPTKPSANTLLCP